MASWPTRGIRLATEENGPGKELARRSREGAVPGAVIPNHAGFRRIGLSSAAVEPRAAAPAKFVPFQICILNRRQQVAHLCLQNWTQVDEFAGYLGVGPGAGALHR